MSGRPVKHSLTLKGHRTSVSLEAEFWDAFQALARKRWRRNAWIQQRSRRNGQIFHAAGPLRWGRDLGMALLGERLVDLPELYRGPPAP